MSIRDLQALTSHLASLARDDLIDVLHRSAVAPGKVATLVELAEAMLTAPSISVRLSAMDARLLARLPEASYAIAGDADGSGSDSATATAPAAGSTSGSSSEIFELEPITDAELARALVDSALALPRGGRNTGGAILLDAVARAVRDFPLPQPDSFESIDAAPLVADATADADAIERAFSAVQLAGEIVHAVQGGALRALVTGTLAHADARRLAIEHHASESALVAVTDLLARAQVIVADGANWRRVAEPANAAAPWATLSSSERWRMLAQGLAHSLPDTIRRAITARGTDALDEWQRAHFPNAAEAELRKSGRISVAALHLGLHTYAEDGRAAQTELGRLFAIDDLAAAASAVEASFPHEIEQFYVQADHTIIAPGPLEPWLEDAIRTFTRLERKHFASEFRLTGGSVLAGLYSGMSANSMLDLLERYSLTGVPQSVRYTIEREADRIGDVVVFAAITPVDASMDAQAGASIRVRDVRLASSMLVDRRLSRLRLARVAERDAEVVTDASDATDASARPIVLATPRAATAVITVLREAGYATTAELSHDESPAPRAASDGDGDDPYVAFADALIQREAQTTHLENDERTMLRVIDLAIAQRSAIELEVDIPGRDRMTVQMVPLALAGSRLRARDTSSDVERTLPVSALRSVRAL